MTNQTQTPQRKTAATTNERGGRTNAAIQNQRTTQSPRMKIRKELVKSFGRFGMYEDAMEFALESLHEAGVEPAGLFDAKTSEVTEKGLEAVKAAIAKGWGKTLELAADGYYETESELDGLLSDKAVFDHIWADLVKRGHIKKPHPDAVVFPPHSR